MSFFSKIIARWRSESPAFFKFLTNLFVTVGAMAFAIMALKQANPERFVFITSTVDRFIDYCLILGAVGAVLAKMTVKNDTKPD